VSFDIVNADIVTGDGESYLEGSSLVIEDGLITDVPRHPYIAYNFYSHRVINAHGGIVLPGLINTHSHAVSFGPTLVWGWPQVPRERILQNLNTHLLQGSTTLMNLDGWVLPHENEASNKIHPLNVRRATLHTPKNVIQSEIESGQRIQEPHRSYTAAEAVASGAIAIGEVGSPSTSFGTYEKSRRLGRVISPRDAQPLDDAYIAGDWDAFAEAVTRLGLDDLGIEGAKKLVKETSIDAIAASDEAILETIEYSRTLGVPALCHTEPPSYAAVLEAARALGPSLLALHVNHHTTIEAAVETATELKARGAHVEVFAADSFGARMIDPDPLPGFALLEKGLADSICTDYCGGYHDPLLRYISEAIRAGVGTLPSLIRLVTSSPAGFIPGLAPNRGLIEEGRVADVIILDRNDITNVRYVIIGGEIVVEEGRIVAPIGA
ncbi:MAG: amidohydrolase family protein, partial [Actinomycetota bacterium]|nr:amidohydrolase family protein [Actinomycetota bacterium]